VEAAEEESGTARAAVFAKRTSFQDGLGAVGFFSLFSPAHIRARVYAKYEVQNKGRKRAGSRRRTTK